MRVHNTYAEAVKVEIADPLSRTPNVYDIEAIADEVIAPNCHGYSLILGPNEDMHTIVESHIIERVPVA